MPVKKAGALWLQSAESAGLERTTLDQYRQHLRLHIEPFIGATKLPQLNVPTVRAFEDRLRQEGRSTAMVRKVLASLGSILADAQERGLVARNAVREMRGRRRRGKERQADRRQKGKLRVGVDIPTPLEIAQVIRALDSERFSGTVWRPFFLMAIFAGLRASELRGLRWQDIDLKKGLLHIEQRANLHGEIGPPKSEAGTRTLPLPPLVVNALRQWKLKCPKGEHGLAFPNGIGNVEDHTNIIERALKPLMLAAGITVPAVDARGKPVLDKESRPALAAKYTGMHALRHFYASWLINARADGGLELPAKTVQSRMGHSTIVVTMDTYGHLFPSRDDGSEFAAAAEALAGLHAT